MENSGDSRGRDKSNYKVNSEKSQGITVRIREFIGNVTSRGKKENGRNRLREASECAEERSTFSSMAVFDAG